MGHPLLARKELAAKHNSLATTGTFQSLDSSHDRRSFLSRLSIFSWGKSRSINIERGRFPSANNRDLEQFDGRAATGKSNDAIHQGQKKITRRRSLGDLLGKSRSRDLLQKPKEHPANQVEHSQLDHFVVIQRSAKPEPLTIEPFKPLEVDLASSLSQLRSNDALEEAKVRAHPKELGSNTDIPTAPWEQVPVQPHQSQGRMSPRDTPMVVHHASDDDFERQKARHDGFRRGATLAPIGRQPADDQIPSQCSESSAVSELITISCNSTEEDGDANDSDDFQSRNHTIPIARSNSSGQSSAASWETLVQDTDDAHAPNSTDEAAKTASTSEYPMIKYKVVFPTVECRSQTRFAESRREAKWIMRNAPGFFCEGGWFSDSDNTFYATLPDGVIDVEGNQDLLQWVQLGVRDTTPDDNPGSVQQKAHSQKVKMAKVATDFEKIINEGREKKKNEALAQKIFSKDRRQSAPTKLRPGAGPSLASRVGVKKRTASLGPKAVPAGNIDGDWTHDLHGSVNGGRKGGRNGGGGGLAARISAPGGKPAAAATTRRSDRRTEQRAAIVANALERSDLMADVQMTNVASVRKGLSIRGLAGPFPIMAQNFAPGTTAADIESAMTPVGGEMLSCRIIKTTPLLLAEMVFATKEGADAVISTFNNQTADGRVIKVYPKPGGYRDPTAQAPPSAPRSLRSTASNVVDGSNGFPEPMAADNVGPSNGLYSDKMVGNGNGGGGGNRRGRGWNRGGRR
ncbi:hypothetical protein CkaCkLH20_07004 [Colletotrichum karsti]|uniref:RRM domain-containing protein n=1 Tax=Colletotrichum karsti TaxID=1095194 RepID=A0A9P6LJF5_9PEZI|nr:uncharacterized protein CkaCkLH20_07004 [Colletotrichum karsti]KAF9875623.1 hypothetical protein CkaCkLH20_07004 [Colletotrichum karsti]